jgi:hypothetical protein
MVALCDQARVSTLAEEDKPLCPHYHLVPKDPIENIEWRKFLIEQASADKEFAADLWVACSRDLLFWINSFCFTLDPRRIDCPSIPFITWDTQDEVLLEIEHAIGRHDLWIEKSRDQGVTWDVLTVYTWHFIFHDQNHFMCASRKEELVDDKDNPNCLFSKIDFILNHLPGWMRPEITRQSMKFINSENGSTITGESTNADLGRGGRQKSVFCDEFPAVPNAAQVLGATGAVCKGRIFVGTHKGTGTVFYKHIRQPGKRVLRVHWTTHPLQKRGLYRSVDGRIEIIDKDFRGKVLIEDKEYRFPEEYPFVADGKVRSPYYDNECCKLGQNKVLIAQEMDIDPAGSAYQFFDAGVLDGVLAIARSKRPCHVGDLMVDWQTGEPIDFKEDKNGSLRLWLPLDHNGKLPPQEYVLGIDIAQGLSGDMSSNSVISIGSRQTREKIGEYATCRVTPEELAYMAYGLAHWMAYEEVPAKIIWEHNGPGKLFWKSLSQLGHTNIYRRKNIDKATQVETDMPGWWSGKGSKETLLSQLRLAYKRGDFLNPSTEAVEECYQYQQLENGSVVHASSANSEDPTGANENHGDRVIADALLWDQIKGKPASKEEAPKEAPMGCLAWRREMRKQLATSRSRL